MNHHLLGILFFCVALLSCFGSSRARAQDLPTASIKTWIEIELEGGESIRGHLLKSSPESFEVQFLGQKLLIPQRHARKVSICPASDRFKKTCRPHPLTLGSRASISPPSQPQPAPEPLPAHQIK